MTALGDILLRVLTTRVAWPIFITVGMLCAVSVFALECSSAPKLADRQQIWILVGCGVVLVSLLPHFHFLGRIGYFLYAATILLLIGVFLAPRVANTHRWFVLPGGIQLQPSELAKIAFVLALAWYLRYRKNLRTFSGLLIPFALAAVPFGLILIEPDLGTAMLFPLTLFAMLVAAGARLRHLAAIVLIAGFALPGAYPLLRPYQQQRVKSLVLEVIGKADEALHNGANMQPYRARIAIGAGGFSGLGDDAALHFRQRLVPYDYTDFIYAVVGGRWGFLGCITVVLMYLAFYVASIEIAASTRDNFGRLMVIGLSSMILFQGMINMYMTVGLGPVTGIALPFVSYGGSSLLASMLAAGLLLNVSIRRNFHSAAH
jgi:cell division protein FtsW (lipid II flippase)